MKSVLRRVATVLAPNLSRRVLEERWLRQHARDFAAEFAAASSVESRVDVARSHQRLQSNQKRSEIVSLLNVLEAARPRIVCEIGSDRGGTLALLGSAVDREARILSMDIVYPPTRMAINRMLCQSTQQLTCLEADSHAAATLARVTRWLDGQQIDFLFIDGDHSYEGVRLDYEQYGPLVRPGGLIAFHDIVEDFGTRFGTPTANDVGGVPIFWSELKRTISGCVEFVEDPLQDGYGIGLIERTGA